MTQEKRLLKGILTEIGDTREGVSPKGKEWKLQKIVITDDAKKKFKVTVWLEKGDDFGFNYGDYLMMPVAMEHKEYLGKPYISYSTNYDEINSVAGAKSENPLFDEQAQAEAPKQNKPTEEYWENRNSQIVHQHSQEMAIRFVDMCLRAGLYSEEEKTSLSRDLFFMEVQKYTDMFSTDILKGEK